MCSDAGGSPTYDLKHHQLSLKVNCGGPMTAPALPTVPGQSKKIKNLDKCLDS